MKSRILLVAIIIVGAVALAAFAWQRLEFRRVDGRDGRAWLTYVEQAANQVSYSAQGYTIVADKKSIFQLQQGTGGAYSMRVTDPKGRQCCVGNDGKSAWYATGAKVESTPVCNCASTPTPHGRVTGTTMVAGRPAVQLSVSSGPLRKVIAVDRKTGVILSMITYFGDRGAFSDPKKISEMAIDRIDYRAVTPQTHPVKSQVTLRPASLETLAKLLGRQPMLPRWLPDGFARNASTFQDHCPCCNSDMAVLRYTDGLATLTVFEMSHMMCAMSSGCHMAPTEGALVDTRNIGDITIVAVGNLSAGDLHRVIMNLR